MLGNLGQEIATQNEPLRKKIRLAFRLWRSSIEECIREGQKLSEIRSDIPAETLANFCLDAWEGAMLRMKVERSRKPLDHFVRAFLGKMLPAAE